MELHKQMIKHHKKILSGERKIDRRRVFWYDMVLGRQMTLEEIMAKSKKFLEDAEICIEETDNV